MFTKSLSKLINMFCFLYTSSSFVHFGHGILSYYLFSFLDGENATSELIDNKLDRTIDEIAQRYKRSDEYHDWNQPYSNKNEKQIGNGISGGAGLFVTLVSALVFEVVENSEAVINTFRKNSGAFIQNILMLHLMEND